MKIEIGKSYEICAHLQESFFEIEQYVNEETKQSLNSETTWRNGYFHVTVVNNDEALELQSCIGSDGEIFDYESFEKIDLFDSWDEHSQNFVFYGPNWTSEAKETLEQMYNGQADEGMYEFLTTRNWSTTWCNFQIHGGIAVEEIDEHGSPLIVKEDSYAI
jgi:hypothetical protein